MIRTRQQKTFQWPGSGRIADLRLRNETAAILLNRQSQQNPLRLRIRSLLQNIFCLFLVKI